MHMDENEKLKLLYRGFGLMGLTIVLGAVCTFGIPPLFQFEPNDVWRRDCGSTSVFFGMVVMLAYLIEGW